MPSNKVICIVTRNEIYITGFALLTLSCLLIIPFLGMHYNPFFAQHLEDSLAAKLGTESIASTSIVHAVLATAASTAPLLLEYTMDLTSTFDAGNLERLSFVVLIFIPKLVKYLVCHHSDSLAYPVSTFYLSLSTQFLGAFGVILITLNRLQPQLFSISFCTIVGLSVYMGYSSSIAFTAYGYESMASTALHCRTVAGLLMMHGVMTPLYHALVSYQNSKLYMQEWIKSIDLRNQHTLLICSTFLAFMLLIFSASKILLDGDIDIFTQEFVVHFNVCSTVFVVLLVVIPHRLMKWEAEKLRHSLDLKKTFVRYISHEIRSPLGVISAGIELLKADLAKETPPSLEEIFTTLDAMQDCCGNGVQILNDLLTYEKLEDGLMVLEKEVQDPTTSLKEVLGAFSLAARSKRVTLTVHNTVERGGCLVYIDESKLNQVFRNLLSNAIKFTNSGGAVEVSIAKVDNHIRVEVKDGGFGLSLENQRKLFHNVVQFNAKSQQGGGGSGFGLWISKKIADMHGGEIGLHSDGEGTGSTFYFTIPLYEPPQSKVNETNAGFLETRAHEIVNPPDSTTARILVVDDSPMNRKMLAKLLESEGHTTYTADDGEVAVHLVKTSIEENDPSRYEIILMDNVMLRMNGPAATAAIMQLDFPGRIIGVTGNVLDEDIKEFMDAGAVKVMPKPFNKLEFKKYLEGLRDGKDAANIARI